MIINLFIFLLTAFVANADPTLDKFMGGGNMMRTPYESYGGYVEEFMSMQCYMKEGKIYVDTDSVTRYPENEYIRHAGIGYMTSGIAKMRDKQVNVDIYERVDTYVAFIPFINKKFVVFYTTPKPEQGVFTVRVARRISGVEYREYLDAYNHQERSEDVIGKELRRLNLLPSKH